MKTSKSNIQETSNMESFVRKMRIVDQKNLRLSKTFKILMWVLSPLYLAIFNIGPNIGPKERLAGVCFALGFLVFALIFTYFLKIYRAVDYGLPTVVMLSNAIKRFQLKLYKIGLAIIPAILVDMGIVLLMQAEKLGENQYYSDMTKMQVFFWSAMFISASIGLIIWRVKQKPLLDTARRMLREIQSE